MAARGGNEFWTTHTELWYLDGMADRLERVESRLLYLPTLEGYLKCMRVRQDLKGLNRKKCLERAKVLIKEFENRERVSL